MNAEVMKQSKLSNEALLALFEAEGFPTAPELDEHSGEVLVQSPTGLGAGVKVVYGRAPGCRRFPLIRFERRTWIRDDVDQAVRNAFCNRVTCAQSWVKACTPENNMLRLTTMLPAAAGIGTDTVCLVLENFLSVCDACKTFDNDHVLDRPS